MLNTRVFHLVIGLCKSKPHPKPEYRSKSGYVPNAPVFHLCIGLCEDQSPPKGEDEGGDGGDDVHRIIRVNQLRGGIYGGKAGLVSGDNDVLRRGAGVRLKIINISE